MKTDLGCNKDRTQKNMQQMRRDIKYEHTGCNGSSFTVDEEEAARGKRGMISSKMISPHNTAQSDTHACSQRQHQDISFRKVSKQIFFQPVNVALYFSAKWQSTVC